MLTRLLRTHLRRYLRQVGVVVTLLAAQTFGNLYLPNLNADIINFGVVNGNIHYIWTTVAFMLAIALVLGVLSIVAVYYGVAGGDGRRRGHTQRGLHPGSEVLGQRDEPFRHGVADHPQYQRYPADPDIRADGADVDGHRADHVRRGHLHGHQGGRHPLTVAGCRRARDGAGPGSRDDLGGATVPVHAGQDRPHHRGAARADHRGPGDPRIRTRPLRGPAFRRGELLPDSYHAAGEPGLRPDHAGVDGNPEPVQRRRRVVRRPSGQ